MTGMKTVRAGAMLLAGTMLSGVPVMAQVAPAGAAPQTTATPVVAPAPVRTIKTLRVEGAQRIEPETVLSYTKLRVGIPYTPETLDQALKDLQASELFADYSISGVETGDIVLRVRENPIINRVILEGNKRLKDDKIKKEIKLAPRQIFTRTAVRQDVARIVELYRRQGRFGAVVEPKMVNLDQNRVDIVFEISEGPKSKVRQINIIGNEKFSDDELRGAMFTKQSRWFRFLSSATSYDQDRLAADQQKLRQFYLTNGYADFRVTSAVAELTPDKKDFIITYVVEEGPRYKFGDVKVDSQIRDFDNAKLAASLPMKKGDWYNAKLVEDSIDSLSQTAGLFGYAFTDVNPDFQRDKDTLTMSITFNIAEAKRTYIERIDINGNTQTQDKVVRREIRVAEGDAFNSFQVRRSQDRINSLGYFQEKLEIKQNPGSTPDRIVLETNVEEQSTGSLQLSAGYSSLERFIIQANITQRNFRGKGQELRAGVNYSAYSKSIELGFTEPYVFDKNIALGVDVFRRDFNSFNYLGTTRQTTYSQVSTGFQVRAGVPLTEYWSLSGRYGLSYDEVGLASSFFNADGTCNYQSAGRYLCDSIGNRWTSSVGYSLIYDSLKQPPAPDRRPSFLVQPGLCRFGRRREVHPHPCGRRQVHGAGQGLRLLGAGRGRLYPLAGEEPWPGHRSGPHRRPLLSGRAAIPWLRHSRRRSARAAHSLCHRGRWQPEQADRSRSDRRRLAGRPRLLSGARRARTAFGLGAREMGLRPSIYVQAGSLWGITRPLPSLNFPQAKDANGNPLFNKDGSPTLAPVAATDGQGRPIYVVPTSTTDPNSGLQTICPTGYAPLGSSTACSGSSANTALQNTSYAIEQFYGGTWKPRVSIGIGVNWNSPFGPLRIDLAKALVTQAGDDPKLITFNVGTQF
ncbi:Outer membrane protein omp85 precursor [Sphingomonas paucimobilis]|nr:Outer membrane protein omp85 precursor [Sphingomonas paucimobilis]